MMRISYYIGLCALFFAQTVLACMPYSADDVFIARFQSSQAVQGDGSNFAVVLSSEIFIFRS